MGGLHEYFPLHAWLVILGLATVAGGAVFVPPTAGSAVGLSVVEHIIVVGAVELTSAIAIAAIVLYYQGPEEEREQSEWRYDP